MQNTQPKTSAEVPSVTKSSNFDAVYEVPDKGILHDLAKEDVAAQLAEMFAGGEGYTSREVWRLRWKLDIRLIPILWFNVLLPAMDKVSHATAALYGLRDDLNLHGDQYSWIGSIFYVCPPCPTLPRDALGPSKTKFDAATEADRCHV